MAPQKNSHLAELFLTFWTLSFCLPFCVRPSRITLAAGARREERPLPALVMHFCQCMV